MGRQIEPVPQGALAHSLETVAPARVDSYEGLPGRFAREVRASGIRATVAAPILVDGHLWGAFARAHRRGRPPTDRATSTTAPSSVSSRLRWRWRWWRGRPSRPPRRALQGCIEDLHTALAELRELARGLHPAVLTERGVPAAL